MIKFRQKEFAKVTASPIRIKRLLGSKVNRFGRKVVQVGNEIALNPGKSASEAIGFAVENPIAATGNTASVVGPLVNPAVLGIPVGSTSIALEAGAKRIPLYKKATRKLGDIYRRSGASKVIEPVVNAGYNSARIMSGAY